MIPVSHFKNVKLQKDPNRKGIDHLARMREAQGQSNAEGPQQKIF